MEYNDFDSFKINESKVMNTKSFNEFTLELGRCRDDIFNLYPDHKFVIETKKGTCFIYSKYESRSKYWDLNQMVEKEGNVDDKNITNTESGKMIKQQYEKLSKLTVNNVYQIPLTPAELEKYNKEEKKNKPRRPYAGGGGGAEWDWFDRYNDAGNAGDTGGDTGDEVDEFDDDDEG